MTNQKDQERLEYLREEAKTRPLTEEEIDFISEASDPSVDLWVTDYKCDDCGGIFKAEQGSRRRFCDTCIGRRQREGWKKRKPRGESDANSRAS
ncbi:MAG: hypothetical protein JSV54_06385 [Chloroflexota bacterium]|nr:MAG: hypothetical protein JSV54_06385 [Chloroflexota bacterium]